MLGAKLIHTSPIEKDKIYYIKCADKFNNYLGECNIAVRGGI